MLSGFPKQLSTNLFEKEMLFANAQNDECRPKVVGRQGQMCAMSPPFLSPDLPDCVKKKVSVESVERHHDHVTERGVTTWYDPSHGNNSGAGREKEQEFDPPPPLDNCEFERVCKVAKLLESWSDQQVLGPADQQCTASLSS